MEHQGINIQNYNFTNFSLVWVCKMASHINGRTETEGVKKRDPE